MKSASILPQLFALLLSSQVFALDGVVEIRTEAFFQWSGQESSDGLAMNGRLQDAEGRGLAGIGLEVSGPDGKKWWAATDHYGAFSLDLKLSLDGAGVLEARLLPNARYAIRPVIWPIEAAPLIVLNRDAYAWGLGDPPLQIEGSLKGKGALPSAGVFWVEGSPPESFEVRGDRSFEFAASPPLFPKAGEWVLEMAIGGATKSVPISVFCEPKWLPLSSEENADGIQLDGKLSCVPPGETRRLRIRGLTRAFPVEVDGTFALTVLWEEVPTHGQVWWRLEPRVRESSSGLWKQAPIGLAVPGRLSPLWALLALLPVLPWALRRLVLRRKKATKSISTVPLHNEIPPHRVHTFAVRDAVSLAPIQRANVRLAGDLDGSLGSSFHFPDSNRRKLIVEAPGYLSRAFEWSGETSIELTTARQEALLLLSREFWTLAPELQALATISPSRWDQWGPTEIDQASLQRINRALFGPDSPPSSAPEGDAP